MGNPFILAVYIGHPGWKSIGGRIGYSAATGIMVILLSWLGIIAVMMSLIPVVAICADPALHRHADRRAGIPGNAEEPRARGRSWRSCRTSRPGASCRSTTRSAPREPVRRRSAWTSSRQVGILYQGLETLGGGAILTSLVLGSIAVFLIEREFTQGRGVRAGRRGHDVLRLHARRAHRLRPIARGRVELCSVILRTSALLGSMCVRSSRSAWSARRWITARRIFACSS